MKEEENLVEKLLYLDYLEKILKEKVAKIKEEDVKK